MHKNDFGHVLILAGSPGMLGAAALTGLAAIRAGAGLVTIGIPKSLNLTLQKKISPVIMTLPLKETGEQTLGLDAFGEIQQKLTSANVLVIGPGLSRHPQTQKLILKLIAACSKPMVIDADALNALSTNLSALKKNPDLKILTPHPGEMARLTGLNTKYIEKNRIKIAKDFVRKHNCILVLKGHRTVVASPKGDIYINKTGNAGMATAGSGDVLAGIIAAFLGQGLNGFEAAKYGVYLHGKAGDRAAQKTSKLALIATDIIENIPVVIKKSSG